MIIEHCFDFLNTLLGADESVWNTRLCLQLKMAFLKFWWLSCPQHAKDWAALLITNHDRLASLLLSNLVAPSFYITLSEAFHVDLKKRNCQSTKYRWWCYLSWFYGGSAPLDNHLVPHHLCFRSARVMVTREYGIVPSLIWNTRLI